MTKRNAASELNHENWDQEDKPEEQGTFKVASSDAMKGRVTKIARRRGVRPSTTSDTSVDEAAPKSVFAGFTGFGKSPDTPAPTKQLFSFLSATPNPQNGKTSSNDLPSTSTAQTMKTVNGLQTNTSAITTTTNSSNSSSSTNSNTSDNIDSDKEYFRKLRSLNESVAKWISSHVSSTPLCILTPVFRDYEKHLANIESNRKKGEVKSGDNAVEKSRTEQYLPEKLKQKESVSEETSAPTSDTNEEKPMFVTSIFGTSANSTSTASATFSFGSSSVSPQQTSLFSFGSSATGSPSNKPSFSFGTGNATSPSAGFSFGAGKPFTFGNVSQPNTDDKQEADKQDDDEEPPKPDHKPVNEDGAVYTKRCKVFVKKDSSFSDRGVGNLFLKPVDGGKTQLIVRADTSLGNVLINVLLSSGLPTQRLGANNVAIVCIPTPDAKPPPVTVLLRVKTGSDADELLETLEKHKK